MAYDEDQLTFRLFKTPWSGRQILGKSFWSEQSLLPPLCSWLLIISTRFFAFNLCYPLFQLDDYYSTIQPASSVVVLVLSVLSLFPIQTSLKSALLLCLWRTHLSQRDGGVSPWLDCLNWSRSNDSSDIITQCFWTRPCESPLLSHHHHGPYPVLSMGHPCTGSLCINPHSGEKR